jgi:hypothetical protein
MSRECLLGCGQEAVVGTEGAISPGPETGSRFKAFDEPSGSGFGGLDEGLAAFAPGVGVEGGEAREGWRVMKACLEAMMA